MMFCRDPNFSRPSESGTSIRVSSQCVEPEYGALGGAEQLRCGLDPLNVGWRARRLGHVALPWDRKRSTIVDPWVAVEST